MGSDGEPAKLLVPYLQRADELQKHEPLVAYYCRLYAMERGLKIPSKERTKITNDVLVSLMKQLEKDKKSLKLGPEDNLYLEGFASNVFAKADKQDRAGRADLNTAKTFYAASIFFEILYQFGELQPDIEQKQKYAVWKAADIRKALKEGRKPEPGPPGGDKDALSFNSPVNSYDLEPTQSNTTVQQPGDTASPPVGKPPPSHDLGRSERFSSATLSGDQMPSQQYQDTANTNVYAQSTYSPSPYATGGCTSSDSHQFPPNERPETPPYPQPYHLHQSYVDEQQHMPQNYYSAENPSPPFSYPNFQSYPSFQDTSLPSVPAHQPSYFHGPDAAPYSGLPAAASNYPVAAQLQSGTAIGNQVVAPRGSPADSYKYDSSYQPPVEKVAEAHKAARYAVGALAFDDVAAAVDHLRRSLDLLTNPSAETR